MAETSNLPATCPECGISLEGKNRETHAYSHWGVTRNNHGILQGEALRRCRLLTGWVKD